MTLTLPEYFAIPDSDDLDDIVDSLDQDIKEEGDAALFLGMIRYERRTSGLFNNHVLRPLSMYALSMEDTDVEGHLRDTQHKRANALLSGMIFGHLINESVYPRIGDVYRPYGFVYINMNFLNHSQLVEHAKLGGIETGQGRRFGYIAMASAQLQTLSEASLEKIDSWSGELVDPGAHRQTFRDGLGFSMYAAWDEYTDRMDEEGREYAPMMIMGSSNDDGGQPPSI